MGKPTVMPRLAIGCGTIALAASQDEVRRLVTVATSGGPCHFDTAPLYASGESERRLGDALTGVARSTYTISTKTGRYPAPKGTGRGIIASRFDYSHDATLESVRTSIDRLGCDRLDAVFVHDLDERQHGTEYAQRRAEALAGAFPALRRLKDAGTVGAIGMASMEWRACLDLVQEGVLDTVMLASGATLLDRDSDPLFEACRRHAVQIIVAAPFSSGILATGAVPGARYRYAEAPPEVLARVEGMQMACERHGVPLAAAALQYPGVRHGVCTVVVGHHSPQEYVSNLELLDVDIPRPLWDELDRL